MRPNLPTLDGAELGKEIARLCDLKARQNPTARKRCATCAFRAGDHLANNSPETLMTAIKCTAERKPFWCHTIGADGSQKVCAGWRLMLSDVNVQVPWDYVDGADAV